MLQLKDFLKKIEHAISVAVPRSQDIFDDPCKISFSFSVKDSEIYVAFTNKYEYLVYDINCCLKLRDLQLDQNEKRIDKVKKIEKKIIDKNENTLKEIYKAYTYLYKENIKISPYQKPYFGVDLEKDLEKNVKKIDRSFDKIESKLSDDINDKQKIKSIKKILNKTYMEIDNLKTLLHFTYWK
jgi:hypothetical protein